MYFQKFISDIKMGSMHYELIAKKYKPLWLKNMEKDVLPKLNFLGGINLLNLIFFGFLKKISLLIFLIVLLSYGLYHFFLSYYLLPHWREFIVKNSPTNITASVVSLLKLSKSHVVVICVACGSIAHMVLI